MKNSAQIPFVVLLTLAFVVGLLTVAQYNESWDEASKRAYADYSLGAYPYLLHPQDLKPYGSELNYYGPAYFMLVALSARVVSFLIPAWTVVNVWHFIYFITFLLSVWILYLISKLYMDDWAALGVALLYCTQPLFWGHAFINPKDTPFATFFMASIYLGFKMVDEQDKKYLWAVFAGLILGLSTSFRIFAPYAVVIVVFYALRITDNELRKKLFFTFIICVSTALAATYLTWPYLWANPIDRFLESLHVMSAFPFDQTVLFQGELYPAADLPLSYVPTLLRIQLTGPLLILFGFGLIISLNHFANKNHSTLALFVLWFFVPVTAIILSGNTLYDNFRQLFFLLPPMFILAGLTLDYIFRKFQTIPARIFILLLISSFGLLPMIQLHPYEYVYYNSSVDGTRGAFRDFEMDYWDTSFPEAARYLNKVAPQNAKVIVIGSVDLFRAYARPDLQIVNIDVVKDEGGKYDYVVIHSRRNLDERRCKEAQMIYMVERQGAILAVIKEITAENQCP